MARIVNAYLDLAEMRAEEQHALSNFDRVLLESIDTMDEENGGIDDE